MKTTAKDRLNEVVQTLIDQMESSDRGWIKGWTCLNGFPTNFVSKKAYRGLNVGWLNYKASMGGFRSPEWITFNQAKKLGGNIKKGEKSSTIFYFNFFEKIQQNAKTGEDELVSLPMLKTFAVFNMEQTEGIDYTIPELPENDNQRFEVAEDFIKRTEANVVYGGDKAFYRPGTDSVHVPMLEQFDSSENYYSTLFHEITHWSGAEHRLNRVGGKYGDKKYAFEELVAELGAAFLCTQFSISLEENRHPEYLKSWAKVLREDSKILWSAASKAQASLDYLLKLTGFDVAEVEDEEAVS